jgi:hypothetical protein
MKRKHSLSATTALAAFALALTQPTFAEWSLQTGVDYTSGEYGASEDTRILYIPLTVKTEGQRYFARVTVPYIEVDAPVGGDIIAIGPDGQPIRASTGDRAKDDGVGDVVAAVGYSVINGAASGATVDVVGKVKFGTAEEEKGLGTGEDDYSVQIDGYKVFKKMTYLLTVGYRVYGDPPDIDFDNVFFGSAGAIYKLQPNISGGLIYDFRESIIAGGDEQSELTAFVTRKIAGNRKVQGYVVGGLSDASPDWGLGLMLTQGF